MELFLYFGNGGGDTTFFAPIKTFTPTSPANHEGGGGGELRNSHTVLFPKLKTKSSSAIPLSGGGGGYDDIIQVNTSQLF